MNKVAKVAVAGAVAMVLGSTVSGKLLPGYVAAAAADDAKKDAPKPQISAAAGKDLQEAQKDMQAQKWDDMLVVLDRVKNNPKKNDYDEHVMNEFYVTAYANKKQLQEATGPLEFIIASKFTPPDEMQKRVIQASFLYYQLQNYDKAIEYGNRAVKDGSATDQVQLVVAQSYYLKNDFKGTETFVTGLVNDQIKAGTTPSNDMLQLGLSSAVKQNDDAGEAHWLELLVTYHPKAEYWQNLLDPLYRTKMPDREVLQLYRLSADVGNMKHGSDYAEMAQAALDAGSPGEAVSVLNKAFADNAFTDPAEKQRNQHLLETAKKQAAADEPTLAKAETDATAAAGGDKLVGVGTGYFGYGQFDKAVKDISAGLAKGATKDTENARLLLGIAQFKAGAKDDAIKTISAVKGDASLQRIAALWVLHIKAPGPAAT